MGSKKGVVGLPKLDDLFKQMSGMQKKIVDIDKGLANVDFTGVAGDLEVGCTIRGNGKHHIYELTFGNLFTRVMGAQECARLSSILIDTMQDYFHTVANSSSAEIASAASNIGLPTDMLGMPSIPGKPSKGFDLSSIQGLLKQMQTMQKKILDMEKQLSSTDFTGKAGESDEICSIVGNGKHRISKLTIGPKFAALMTTDECEMLMDMIVVAFHDFCKQINNASGANLANVASEMGLPSDILQENLAGLLGSEEEFK